MAPDDLLKNVDVALYQAKFAGSGHFVFFTPAENEKIRERHRLEADLKHALDRGELVLHYQPIINLKSHQVTSFEALMRWNHSERGLIAPLEFIPMAEQTGVIVRMGEWALEQACADAASWPEPIKVTVNLSPAQFDGGNLVQATTRALERSKLEARRLEFEVTENVLLRDAPRTHEILHKLHALGVQIALDDFGTAFASLSFQFDKIKIDRTFVRDVRGRNDSYAIIRAVSELARSLKIETVAEGVETREHLATVGEAGCDEVQGFFFSHPVPSSEVGDVLALCRLKCVSAAPFRANARTQPRRLRRLRRAR